jgi:UDP-3-O-[3-hydroxymyristoyl] N-acetylglucosamine deacetylase
MWLTRNRTVVKTLQSVVVRLETSMFANRDACFKSRVGNGLRCFIRVLGSLVRFGMRSALGSNVMEFRTTIARPVSLSGVGLHSGEEVVMNLRPADAGTGVVFVRTDLEDAQVKAVYRNLGKTAYATTLTSGGVSVATVEHLLSAVAGLSLDDLVVELSAGEVPILDGSAMPFVRLLERAGRRESTQPRQVMRITRPVSVRQGEKSISIAPGRGLKVHYTINFDHPVLKDSRRLFTLRPWTFARDIAPARTFCRLEEVEDLRKAGLVKGGTLDNALVVDQKGLLNGPLRYRDEFVRHKILDLLGDLALLGRPVEGTIIAERAGHGLHACLVEKILAQPDSWSLVPATAALRPSIPAIALPA